MSKPGAAIKPPNLFKEIILKLLIYISKELKTYSNNDPKSKLVNTIVVECETNTSLSWCIAVLQVKYGIMTVSIHLI